MFFNTQSSWLRRDTAECAWIASFAKRSASFVEELSFACFIVLFPILSWLYDHRWREHETFSRAKRLWELVRSFSYLDPLTLQRTRAHVWLWRKRLLCVSLFSFRFSHELSCVRFCTIIRGRRKHWTFSRAKRRWALVRSFAYLDPLTLQRTRVHVWLWRKSHRKPKKSGDANWFRFDSIFGSVRSRFTHARFDSTDVS